MNKSFTDFLNSYGINVKNLTYYKIAFTHGSFRPKSVKKDYQRLEFLGDAILQFLTSEFIFKKHKGLDQGNLTLLRTKIVCTDTLNEFSNKLNLKDYIFAGDGKMAADVKKSKKVGADIFESLVAAIYLDSGLNAVKRFLNETLFKYAYKIDVNENLKDAKSTFQEHIQSFSKQSVIYNSYQLNNGLFKSEATHDGKIYGTGVGKSKIEAEEKAAAEALKKLIN